MMKVRKHIIREMQVLFVEYTFFTHSKQTLDIFRWKEQAAAFVIVTFIFSVLGPFETYQMAFLPRALYWSLTLLAGWVCNLSILVLLLRNPRFDDWPAVIHIGLLVMLAIVPTWLLISLVDWKFFSKNLGLEGFINHLSAPVFMNSVFCNVIIVGGMYYLIQSRLGISGFHRISKESPFFARIPFELGTDIISISTHDHYVEVTTKLGSKLILMRFVDALNELSTVKGLQIHRSHWAAMSAASCLKRDDGKLVLELIDGRELPVSRTYVQTVRSVLQKAQRRADQLTPIKP